MIAMMLKPFAVFLWPLLGGLFILLSGAAKIKAKALGALTLLVLVVGLLSLCPLYGSTVSVSTLFTIDPLGQFFTALLFAATFVVALLGMYSLDKSQAPEVFFACLLFCTIGMSVVTMTEHLAVFFLGLEIYTACLYILIAFFPERKAGTEAAIKYLVLGGISSAFILLGIGLLYLGFGSLELPVIAERLTTPNSQVQATLWLPGTLCLFVGLGFKLSLVPFHMWAPDVYQGAPTSVTTLIASGSKLAMVAFAIRYLTGFQDGPELHALLTLMIVASVVVGNLLALYQPNLKRLLAYSSIAHIGYALIPLATGESWHASLIYIVTYLATVLATFTLLFLAEGDDPVAGNLKNYRSLGQQRPLLAAGIALCFFSLAGIPMTAGFIGKWSVFQSALVAKQYLLVGTIAVGALIGAFYYLRVVATLYFGSAEENRPNKVALRPVLVGLSIILLLKVLAIGLYPEPLFQEVRVTADQTGKNGFPCCGNTAQTN